MKVENDSAFPVRQTKSVYQGDTLGTVSNDFVGWYLFFFKQIPPFTSPLIVVCPSVFHIPINYAGMAVKWIVFHFNYSFKCDLPGRRGSVLAHGFGIFLLLVWFWICGFFGGEGWFGGIFGVFLLVCFWFCSSFFPRRPRYLLMDPVCFVLCGISSKLSFSDTRAQCIHWVFIIVNFTNKTSEICLACWGAWS